MTSALNDYLQAQFNNGRLEASKLKKIADAWHHQGRPRVHGFRYDMETQIDLIKMHLDDFKFYGRETMNHHIVGILDMMKTNARVIRVRTFCQPDTVIAKQLLDSQHLFNVIGATPTQHNHLVGATLFFKDAIERQWKAAGHWPEHLTRAAEAEIQAEKDAYEEEYPKKQAEKAQQQRVSARTTSSLRTAKSLSPEKWQQQTHDTESPTLRNAKSHAAITRSAGKSSDITKFPDITPTKYPDNTLTRFPY